MKMKKIWKKTRWKKMEIKKYKKIFSFLLLSLIVFSTINSSNQHQEKSSLIDDEIPLSNGDPTALYLQDDVFLDREARIRMIHTKGTSDIFWSMSFGVISSSPLGTYSFTPKLINSFNNLYFVSTGELNYQSPYIYHFNEATPTTTPLYTDNVWITIGGRSDSYLLQTNGINDYADISCEFMLLWSNYDSSGQILHNAPTSKVEFHLYWELHPLFEINSDYYNFDNIRIEIYDKTNAVWFQQDPTNIILQHPEYKIRVYDKETNDLVFEDSDYQYFKYYREIQIDTLKIVNNAPEPINTSIIENGHYKGAYSFDLDGVNTQPTDFVDSSGVGCLTYISDEIDGHNKVLTLDDRSSTVNSFLTNSFSDSQEFGSIEWYWGSDDILKGTTLTIYPSAVIWLQIFNGYMGFYNGTTTNFISVENDVLYHCRLTFECGLGLYDNLFPDTWNIYIDGEKFGSYNFTSVSDDLSQIRMLSVVAHINYKSYFDAFDFSWSEGYYEGRNLELNTSEDLWNWNAFPEWESGHYGIDENLDDWNDVSGEDCDVSIVDEIDGRKNVLQFYDNSNLNKANINRNFNSQSYGSVAFNFRISRASQYFAIAVSDDTLTQSSHFMFRGYDFQYYDGVYNDIISLVLSDTWYQCVIDFRCTGSSAYKGLSENRWQVMIDNVVYGEYQFRGVVSDINELNIETYPGYLGYYGYVDALSFSWDDNYFEGMNTLENTTTSPFPMEINYSTQVNPYSSVFTNYTLSNYLVGITDLYDNALEVQSLSNSSEDNEIIYTPPNVRTCLISLSDQRSNYLEWQNYRIKIDGNSIYEQYFYKEISTIVNISIYDRFDQYLTSQFYTVQRDDNFINIQLTLHSLKIFNQQEIFNYVNVTRDPNYYDTTESWSEWIAPGEIIEYKLFQGYYKVNITDNENSQNTVYSYTLQGDDMLLITSSYTLTNTITNIANVNSTIGNQITNVEINITNQNSEINSSIVNVEINLTNVNSTLGDLLVAQNTTINAIGNNLTTLFVYEQSTFNILNNSIDTSFTQLNSSIYLVNNSIYTAVSAVEANLNNVNNTISGNLTMILQINEELTNLFINAMFARYLDWTNASIDSDYIFAQTEYVDILNEYNDESLEIYFKYQNEIETLVLSAQDTLSQLIPNENVTYRWKSLDTGEYLTEWEEIPDNKTISYGMFEDTYIEGDLTLSGVSSSDFIIAFILIIAGSISIFYSMRKMKAINPNNIKKSIFKQKEYSTGQSNPLNSMRNRK